MSEFRWLFTWLWVVLGLSGGKAMADEARAPLRTPETTSPQWIWSRDTCADTGLLSPDNRDCRLQRSFLLERPLESATLQMAGDFCHAAVSINGRGVLTCEPYCPTCSVDVTAAMRAGENRIAVTARAVPGPAALALSLSLVFADGTRHTLVTDDQWTASTHAAAAANNRPAKAISMGAVAPAHWGLNRRPATIDPFDNYEQWRQAVGAPAAGNRAAFWTAPGFEISLVRSAQPEEGSWVSMAFDPQGRITIAREDQGLLRMTLDRAGRAVEQVEAINRDLLECRGLLYAHGALYANANNSKGVYLLRDTDGDEQFDEVKLLRQFSGGVGHGRNDLALGPDGMIYSMHGDSVDVPGEEVADFTSPLREARRGQKTQEGHLVRTDPEGKKWELVCAGLRNPFGIAFSARGDLFTYDADAEFDMGTPWYRPTRIVQLVSGADYGWRGVTGTWPPYFPDHADNGLPTLDIGKGSPTAVAFGTQTKFPADYREALFVLDWAYGRMVAVHLSPRGAGYRAQAETFLKGRPLNVTDLAVGPDGAMYLVTGGRKTQSALYRIAFTGGDSTPAALSPHEQACQEHAALSRRLRLEIEEGHRPGFEAGIDAIWPQLNSSDPMIRHAARIAIEHQPLASWRERALSETQPTGALTGLMALARAADKDAIHPVIDRLLSLEVKDLDVGQMLMLLQTYALCEKQSPDAMASRKEKIAAQLHSVFPHEAARWLHVSPSGTGAVMQRELAGHLLRLGSAPAVAKTVRTLLPSAAQEDRLMALFVLRNARQGWSRESRREYFSALNGRTKFLSGEGMPRFLASLREESTATLSDAERVDVADLLAAASEPVEADVPPPVRPTVKKWSIEDFATQLADAPRGGDAQRGAAIFREALCIRCHRVGARGPAVGPDLTHVAGRFSRRDILESILTPAKVVAENYRNAQVRTHDGRVIVGRVLIEGDYRSEKVRIATEPLRPSVVVELSKRDIDEYRPSDTSPMPQGLLDSYRAEEILDLLAFLEDGGETRQSQ